MTEPNEMLLVPEAAKQIRVAPSTIYRLIEAGELRALRVGRGKGTLRIPVEAWDEYLTTCEEAAKAGSSSIATRKENPMSGEPVQPAEPPIHEETSCTTC